MEEIRADAPVFELGKGTGPPPDHGVFAHSDVGVGGGGGSPGGGSPVVGGGLPPSAVMGMATGEAPVVGGGLPPSAVMGRARSVGSVEGQYGDPVFDDGQGGYDEGQGGYDPAYGGEYGGGVVGGYDENGMPVAPYGEMGPQFDENGMPLFANPDVDGQVGGGGGGEVNNRALA